MKKLIIWSDAYSIGFKKIDEQHQRLVELINTLYDAFLSAKANDVIGDILDSMIKYTENHFKYEENIFQRINYPKKDEHKELHGLFLVKTLEFKQKFIAGTTTVSYETMYFLRDWLLKHIQGEDVKYVKYFKEKGV